ncbi:hypothetical protein PS662_03630 [Pseudomonas fluorescens]|uniref:Lipopolysaccharide assembly protein A domain-containing protein n=1 Tax=Pseudomonas fluorescens TaxID=294 RepID=A0A5E6UM52_PSEFL|nr:lipopolysaccharide assembly protein LapA domain-containing protein [Pseudomonas fluorescens]VVN06710.1 hypothetical protein PS662_03630 [Pseudomonas fluorescens]
MKNFKRATIAAFLLVVGLIVVLFFLENRQVVSLFFLGWATPQLPVSAWVLLALLTGMVISPILVWFKGIRGRHSLVRGETAGRKSRQ